MSKPRWLSTEAAARTVPFVAFAVFIVFAQISWLTGAHEGWRIYLHLFLYPVRAAVAFGLLIYFWPQYRELKNKLLSGPKEALLVVAVGLALFALVVGVDWPSWTRQGSGNRPGYNPFQLGPVWGPILAGARVFGASIVIPMLEELFYRSFLLRRVISKEFDRVPVGTFELRSFVVVTALFGIQHELWLAGILGGLGYAGLVYYSKRLWPSILAHGVTNFALAMHVLANRDWQSW